MDEAFQEKFGRYVTTEYFGRSGRVRIGEALIVKVSNKTKDDN